MISPTPRVAAGGDVVHALFENVNPDALGADTVPETMLLKIVEFWLTTFPTVLLPPVAKMTLPG